MGVRNLAILVLILLVTATGQAQTKNLLQNSNADAAGEHWRAFGNAIVERDSDGSHFTIRHAGYFLQDVALPGDSAGKYALLIGRVSSERINPDGAITGLPYLYGYMLADSKVGKINDYLQGQQMLGRAKEKNAWVVAWGVFKIPEGTTTIRYFLNQAERQGLPHDGSAARFDDLGLYVFATAEEAKVFVDLYSEGTRYSRLRGKPSIPAYTDQRA
jgi:hypothetical protein